MDPPSAPESSAKGPAQGQGEVGAALASGDEQELAALLAGDEAAFLSLVKRHHAAMVRVACMYLKSRASAEEVAQEAWIGVLNGLPLFQRRSSLRSWIFRIVVNCAKRRGERDSRETPMSSFAEGVGEEEPSVPVERFQGKGERWEGHWSAPPEVWPDALVESREMASLVGEALEGLPAAQRAVMTLRDVEGWESSEVCELLGITEANQRVLLHRARSKVRGHVEERLGREGQR